MTSSLSPKQFKKQSAEDKQLRYEKLAERHDILVPMKETIRSQGHSYSEVSGYLKKNSKNLFGAQLTKKDTLHWAVKKHAEDPDNFLKNIGFK